MNAGMYHADYSPVGLYVSDGEQSHDLVTAGGAGNFGMLPNGVTIAKEMTSPDTVGIDWVTERFGVEIADVGHLIHYETPQVAASAVRRFLRPSGAGTR